jgi:hypothetical protein
MDKQDDHEAYLKITKMSDIPYAGAVGPVEIERVETVQEW